jgi:hypothetical protein
MRRFCYPVLCALFLGTLCTRPAPAEGPAPTPEEHRKAVALVRQLGSRSFRVREQAAGQLMKMKLAARRAVEEGLKDKDPEVRRRCGQLLPDILRAELFGRIAAFSADKQGKRDHHLPGWKLFRELAGPGEDARQAFAELSRREPELLELMEKDPSRAGALCARRCDRLWNNLNAAPRMQVLPGEVLPLFLVSADKRVGVGSALASQLCSMLERPGLSQELTIKGPGSPFKRLVVGWLMRQKGGGNANARGHALVAFGKADAKAHMALFESLLDDNGSVAGFGIGVANGPNIQGQTEVRDIALAMLVHATGQKHDDYGFAYTRAGRSFLFNAPFLGFSTKEQREAAFKKWQSWKAAQNQMKKK